jgi:hypothetical protein
MTTTTIPRLRATSAILGLSIGLFLLFAHHLAPFVPDDSYISFRYAEHLGHGQGLTYNPGEPPVEGYSNLLWILLCAPLAGAGLELAVWAPRLGVALGVLSLGLLWLILVRRGTALHHLALVLLLFATSGPCVLYAVSGLETPLGSFLLLGAMFAAERVFASKRGWLPVLALCGILFALCRPEGGLLFPATLTLLLLARNRRYRAAEIAFACALFLVAMAAYQAWRMSYFHAPLPTPFLSKGTVGTSLAATWLANLRCLFLRQNHFFAPFGYYHGALLVAAVLAVRSEARRSRQLPFAAVPVAIALLYGAIYFQFVDWMPGMRYFVPLVGLALVALGGGEGLANGRLRPGSSTPVDLLTAYALVLAIGLSSVAVLKLDSRRNEASTRRCLVELGSWLHENVPSRSTLAMSDVGATPYYSELRTIDINPRSLTDRQIAHAGWSDRYFFQCAPDVVVLVSFSATQPVFYRVHQRLFDSPRFQREYRLIGVTRYDEVQDRAYWVFAADSIRLRAEQLASFPAGIGRRPAS